MPGNKHAVAGPAFAPAPRLTFFDLSALALEATVSAHFPARCGLNNTIARRSHQLCRINRLTQPVLHKNVAQSRTRTMQNPLAVSAAATHRNAPL